MSALFTYNNGVYKVKIEGTGSAVKTITSNHVVGGAKVLGERKNNKYNQSYWNFCKSI
jgi:ribosomal protein L4